MAPKNLRGQLPVESLLLALILCGLLVHPLLEAPGHDAALRRHREVVAPTPFLTGTLRLKDLAAAMGGVEYHGSRYREGFAAVAVARVQPLPGWPNEGSPSLLERQLGLPAGWSPMLLVYEDLGVTPYTLDPESIQVMLTPADQPGRVGRSVTRQLGGQVSGVHPRPDLRELELPVFSFSGNNAPTSFEMPILFKGAIDFEALGRVDLLLGAGIERLTLEKPLPPAAHESTEGR